MVLLITEVLLPFGYGLSPGKPPSLLTVVLRLSTAFFNLMCVGSPVATKDLIDELSHAVAQGH